MHGMLLSVRSGRKTSFKIHFQAAANRSDRRLVCYASPQRAIATTAVAELLGRKLWWHPVKGRRPLDREAQRVTPEASSHCEPTSGGPCAPVRAARFWILYAPFFRASANQFCARGSSTDRSEPSDPLPPIPWRPDPGGPIWILHFLHLLRVMDRGRTHIAVGCWCEE